MQPLFDKLAATPLLAKIGGLLAIVATLGAGYWYFFFSDLEEEEAQVVRKTGELEKERKEYERRKTEFLAYKNSAFYSAIVTDVWVGTPMVSLFFLAAMQGVSRDLYEAAWVDGASRWYRFRRITIPQIMPVIVSMALLSAIWTFNSFDIIYILTQGGPRGGTTTMIIDTYKTAIGNFKFGEGATRAVAIVVILGLFSLAYLNILNRVNKYYGVK